MVRLKLATIERKPKKVIVSPTWRDPAGIANKPAFAVVLSHIRKCIENGTPLPSKYYSKSAGMRTDALLQTLGIMHIHLGNWTTKELLWVVQYSDRVVWLELSDHAPFNTRPPGARLASFHHAAMVKEDAAVGVSRSPGKIDLKPKAESAVNDKGPTAKK